MAREVVRRYDAAGGGLLARGLAFVAMFALIPGLLVMVAIAGLFIGDAVSRDRLAGLLAGQFAPLAPLVRSAVDDALRGAPTFSVVGIALLVWSASSVVRALDVAVARVFEETPDSHGLNRLVLEVVIVAVAFVGVAMIVVLLVVPSPLTELFGARPALRATAVPTLAVAFALAYRFLPTPRPGWRAVLWPAFWIGLAVSILTALYGGLGQLFTSSAQLFGAFAAVFVGLLWLAWVAQLFLLGAAWVRVRSQGRRLRAAAAGGASPGSSGPGIRV